VSPLGRTLSLLLCTAALVGCDSSSEWEGCVYSDDPGASPGSRRDECPTSLFASEDYRARDVAGVVRRGEDLVEGAVVRLESTAGFRTGEVTAPVVAVTDSVGFFGPLRPIAFRYDASIKLDQSGAALLFYRGVAGRYFEPGIEGPHTFTHAWTSRLDVMVDRAVPEGRSLAFFVTGDGVYTVTGDIATGLSVMAREYSMPAALHAVEYETARGFEGATAYGKADVTVDAGKMSFVSIALQPITEAVEPKFSVTAPAGVAPPALEIRLNFFSRTSDAHLATIPAGSSRRLPLVPNAAYTYRATSVTDGAVSDTGEVSLDPRAPLTKVELPAAPVAASPLDGESRAVGESLIVNGKGVFEHLLVPQGGGPTMRIITAQHETTLPDGKPLGAQAAVGAYTWTVRNYPTARWAEDIGWLDARRYRPMGVSKPRTLILR
jgi:hypothetical protein